MYDRKNMKVIDMYVIIRISIVLLLFMALLFILPGKVFAVGGGGGDRFYEDYTIVEYRMNWAENHGKTYTLIDAYEWGDVLCIRFFQTQYPFASASFNLLSIGIKQSLLSQMTGGFYQRSEIFMAFYFPPILLHP